MEYRELSKIFHMDTSASREERLNVLAEERRQAPSTFRLGYTTRAGELFIAVPKELSVLNERVLRRERKISKCMQFLPPIGSDEVLRSLVFDEVVSSNDVENIHSTREQIETALNESSDNVSDKRFREFARIYLDFMTGNPEVPYTPIDIRRIYDKIMDGEQLEKIPDGKIFRKDTVVVTNGTKVIHKGVFPEDDIVDAMDRMLRIISSDEIPSLLSAIASHYIFEYAHPFYDGNGRTGRYLLSAFLNASLSLPTALSLSRAIADNREDYYKAFSIADDPLNKGELTFFVMTMMELIFKSQDELIHRLENNIDKMNLLSERMEQDDIRKNHGDKEIDLIFLLAQYFLFGMRSQVPLKNLASNIHLSEQQTRLYLSRLESKGVVEKVKKRNPITFKLAESFKQLKLSGVFDIS